MNDIYITQKPPSQKAIIQYLNGHPQGLEKILFTYAGRALMIGMGLYLFSDKDKAVKNALIASGVIELYLLVHYASIQQQQQQEYLQ